MATLTTRGLLKLAGINDRSILDRWMREGLIQPVVAGERGRSKSALWSIYQAVVLSIGRRAVDEGLSIKAAGHIVRLLGKLTPAELDAAIASGRRYLMCHGDELYPKLVHRATVESQPKELLLGVAICKPRLMLIDVGLAWQRINQDLEILKQQVEEFTDGTKQKRHALLATA